LIIQLRSCQDGEKVKMERRSEEMLEECGYNYEPACG